MEAIIPNPFLNQFQNNFHQNQKWGQYQHPPPPPPLHFPNPQGGQHVFNQPPQQPPPHSDPIGEIKVMLEQFATNTNNTLKEMQGALKNQQAAHNNLEKYVGLIMKVLQELSDDIQEATVTKPDAQCNVITTTSGEVPSESIIATIGQKSETFKSSPVIRPYQPRIPYPERLMENRREVVFVRQEEMNVLEDEEDSNAQGDIEELEKLLGHEVGGDEEDQAEENALMSMQQEEIFEVDNNTKEKRVFYIDEFDEILEEEWRNSQGKKDEEEMILGDDKFDPDADLMELEQLLGYKEEIEVKEANLGGSEREKLIKDIKQIDPPNFYHKTLVEKKDPQEEIWMMLPKEEKEREEMEKGMVEENPNEGTPNKIPPKPPEYPFLHIPKVEHTRRKRTHDEHVAKTKWEQLKKGKVGSKKRKSQAKGGYEQRRDKWKEDNNHGEKGKRKKGVKASPDATVPT